MPSQKAVAKTLLLGWLEPQRRTSNRCARFKKPQNLRSGQLQPMVVREPWERLEIDVTGPHRASSRGNVYVLALLDGWTTLPNGWKFFPCATKKQQQWPSYWSSESSALTVARCKY